MPLLSLQGERCVQTRKPGVKEDVSDEEKKGCQKKKGKEEDKDFVGGGLNRWWRVPRGAQH